MSQLIKLRRKINSIKTTRKITFAMRLISMSLYSKLEKINIPINYYEKIIKTLFEEISLIINKEQNPILFPKDVLNTNPLIILISSTKGFCGSFNAELFRFFRRNFFLEEHQKPFFITIGHKAKQFLEQEKLGRSLYNFDTLKTTNYLFITNEITKIIMGNENNFSSITAYSNFFKNFFIQNPKKTILTPFELDKKNLHKEQQKRILDDNLIWEGNKNEIVNFIALKYLRTKILNLLFQSLYSEQASRFLAMENATSNADKFLEKLTLEYNKSRQSLITKELLELSASFSAFN
jgi:F-type H+-transporting ATPase subunit gamma